MKNKKSFFRILTVCLLAAALAFAAVACNMLKDNYPQIFIGKNA